MKNNETTSRHIVVKLPILYSIVTERERESYDRQVSMFEEAVEEWKVNCEIMGSIKEPKPIPPKEPGTLDYREVYIDFENKIIDSWIEDFDEKRNCSIIVLGYFLITGGEIEYIKIKISADEWLTVFQKLNPNNVVL